MPTRSIQHSLELVQNDERAMTEKAPERGRKVGLASGRFGQIVLAIETQLFNKQSNEFLINIRGVKRDFNVNRRTPPAYRSGNQRPNNLHGLADARETDQYGRAPPIVPPCAPQASGYLLASRAIEAGN